MSEKCRGATCALPRPQCRLDSKRYEQARTSKLALSCLPSSTRSTGLIDPKIEIRPASGQVDDLLEAIRLRVEKKERVLVTTLTKRMAEELTEYYAELGVRIRYLHSDITTIERMEIIRELREGGFDVLVGINLLREGLDIPEVSLVAILDADKALVIIGHGGLV